MCTYSVVMDYGRTRIPPEQWTRNSFSEFQEVLLKLQALDEKLSQPDCEDPAKAAWMRDIEQRLAKLEGAGS